MKSHRAFEYVVAFGLVVLSCRVGWDTWAVAITTGATRLCIGSQRPVFPEGGVLGDVVEFDAERGRCFDLIRVHGVSFDLSEAVNYAEIRARDGRSEIEALSTDAYAIQWSRVARDGALPILARLAIVFGLLGTARWCLRRTRMDT